MSTETLNTQLSHEEPMQQLEIEERFRSPRLLPDYVPPASGLITLSVGCEFKYHGEWPTPTVVQVEPRRDGPHRIIQESWSSTPDIPTHEYLDSFGNRCRRLTMPAGDVTLKYDALVEVTASPDEIDPTARQVLIEDLPDETLLYTLPSRYCFSDMLSDDTWKLFGTTEPTWGRVQAICDWIYNNINYKSGSSTPFTTAFDVYEQRAGICRDFAHMGVTLCRAMNIPARYVFGYFPDIAVVPPDVAMDFHAWFEVFLDGRWRPFDARHNVPRIGRVPIARGRDAVDCAMITTYGTAAFQSMIVWTDEVPPGTRLEDGG